MTPLDLVARAHSALVVGNLADHLAHVSDTVTWRVNSGAPRTGKESYSAFVALLIRSDEIKEAISIQDVSPTDTGEEGVKTFDVCDARWVPAASHGGERVTVEKFFYSRYQVRNGELVAVHLSAFGAPTKKYTYP